MKLKMNFYAMDGEMVFLKDDIDESMLKIKEDIE